MADPEQFDSSDEAAQALREWVEGDLYRSFIKMHLYRDIYWSWNEMLEMTTDDVRRAGHFHGWVRDGYIAFVAMGVRRELDRGIEGRPRPRSLRMFLGTVKENAHLLDREWYMSRTGGDLRVWAGIDDSWAELANAEGIHVDPEKVQADIDLLFDAGRTTYDWATAHMAHSLEDRAERRNPTYGEIHNLIDELEAVWRRWYLVFTETVLADLDPDWWEWVLTTPWLDDDQATELFNRRRRGGPQEAHPEE